MNSLLDLVGTKILKSRNRKVSAPPGKIRRTANLTNPKQKHIFVPTIMRTGTHVLIDGILNNFICYKQSPLYVDFDRFIHIGSPTISQEVLQRVERLANSEGYILKSHIPQLLLACQEKMEIVRNIAANCYVVTIRRDIQESYESTRRFHSISSYAKKFAQYEEEVYRFHQFWGQFSPLQLDFNKLTNTETFPLEIDRVSQYLGIPTNKKLIFPQNSRLQVYFAKTFTRLLGNKASIVNTGIAYRR